MPLASILLNQATRVLKVVPAGISVVASVVAESDVGVEVAAAPVGVETTVCIVVGVPLEVATFAAMAVTASLVAADAAAEVDAVLELEPVPEPPIVKSIQDSYV